MPKITILVPCKDANASFFREALASVLAQTDPRWRLLVVDDHSSLKETLALLGELRRSQDERIDVIRAEGSQVTGALNSGMRAVTTPFVCTLHCDDLLDARAIETLTRQIERRPEVDYFHSARLTIDGEGNPIGTICPPTPSFELDDFKRFGQVKHLHCWRVRAALSIGGMDETLGPHGADDYDFSWSMAEAGFCFAAVPECLYYYRDHQAHFRLTTHVPLDRQIAELKTIWRKHGLTELEIEEQLRIRTAGYLSRALYKDDEDRRQREPQE